MLDDDKNTPTTETSTTSRTRRRAAARPAGPPAAVSTDIFAPPEAPAKKAPSRAASGKDPATKDSDASDAGSTQEAPARRTAKKAAPSGGSDGDTGSPDAPAKKAAAKKSAKKSTSAGSATKKTAAKKTAVKDDAAPEEADATASGQEASTASDDRASSGDRPARKRSGRKPAASGDDAGTAAVAFQAPEPVTAPARDDRSSEGRSSDGTDSDEQGDDSGDGSGGGPKRRRRSRGGRRRNKSDDTRDGSDSSDGAESGEAKGQDDGAGGSSNQDDSGDGGDGEGQSTNTRRRRRRARSGERASASPDDPENTVVRVREGRNPEDEITGVAGSTRLEAKKQRRREGREAGRRRAPIVSEAEFLARREAVDRQMVVRQHVSKGSGAESDAYTQIAVLEDSVLVEHYVARESQTSLIGNVYLGKVQNVLPSMEAAFVDIGAGRNAVIYAGEVDWSGVQNGKARKIEEALTPGQQILVQVSKDPIGQKGARLTSQISLPGRFLVYVPGGQSNGISRKLPDTERARLKALLKEVLPEDAGVIVRTAAEGASEDQLTRDVTALTARWDDIKAKAGIGEDGTPSAKGPQLLYAEPDLVIKVVRDLFNEDFASLVVEGSDAWDNISGYLRHVAPDLAERLQEWSSAEHDGRDSFDVLRIDEQIHKALDRKVWLPSGGSLVIDRTEAMTVVDVNTGKFTGSGGNLEETVTKNNLEAAEEIVRQLRLRDIGGIIVIDFIDMVLESNRDLVLRRLVECLGRDRTRHQVAEVTSLGLVQMTRKRIGTGLLESFSTDCDHCNGRGVVITAEPVEPKKDEPRGGGRQRRGRGGNGGNDNGGSNGGGGNNGGGGGGNNGGGGGNNGGGGGNNGGGNGSSNGSSNGNGGSRRGQQKPATEEADSSESTTSRTTSSSSGRSSRRSGPPKDVPTPEDGASAPAEQLAEPSEQETPAPAVDAALEPESPALESPAPETGDQPVEDAVAPEAETAAEPVQDPLPEAEQDSAPDVSETDGDQASTSEDAPVLTEPGDGP
ncbi:Rne/Rng family ribonuclease [Aeromicrobium sp. Leaf291]|uniref:Rne/Rng family ribonuclease n=1 Tax=Aeromicrobium sp. Leaf291 TaxID=1736325 RepID=UPI000700894C|nr:Rne/Rng family ribonuclease [Aeromicrobium sp. Leaf291]KQP84755.1 ribonuclease G [Aeromicrobium sp. Leaf291]